MTHTLWFVYLLECANGHLYTGITVDLQRRFRQHCLGRGARYTRSNPPRRMIAAQICQNRSQASALENTIKALSAAEKRQAAAHWTLTQNLPSR